MVADALRRDDKVKHPKEDVDKETVPDRENPRDGLEALERMFVEFANQLKPQDKDVVLQEQDDMRNKMNALLDSIGKVIRTEAGRQRLTDELKKQTSNRDA